MTGSCGRVIGMSVRVVLIGTVLRCIIINHRLPMSRMEALNEHQWREGRDL